MEKIMLGTKIDTLENKKNILEWANQKAGSLKKISKNSKSSGKWSRKKKTYIYTLKNEDKDMTKRRACVHAQSCPTLCNPVDCSPSGSSVHRILQVRTLEWVANSSSRGSSRPKDQTHVFYISCIGRRILYHWATWEAQLRDSRGFLKILYHKILWQ